MTTSCHNVNVCLCPLLISVLVYVLFAGKFLKLSKYFRSRALTPFSRKKLMRILGFANFGHFGPDGRERQSSWWPAEYPRKRAVFRNESCFIFMQAPKPLQKCKFQNPKSKNANSKPLQNPKSKQPQFGSVKNKDFNVDRGPQSKLQHVSRLNTKPNFCVVASRKLPAWAPPVPINVFLHAVHPKNCVFTMCF